MNVYVASPYQIPSSLTAELAAIPKAARDAFIEWRALATLRLTARLQYADWQTRGHNFFYTPIGYEHFLSQEATQLSLADASIKNPAAFTEDGDYWMQVDRGIFPRMDAIVVLALPGWTRSSGVWEEVNHMRDDLIGAKIVLYANSGDGSLIQYPATKAANEILSRNEVHRYATIFQRGKPNTCRTAMEVVNYLAGVRK